MRWDIRRQLMRSGVTLIDPPSTFIDAEVSVGHDTTIWPATIITRGSQIGTGCSIGSACLIHDSRIGDDCCIQHCAWIADSVVHAGACVGPFASVSGGAQVAKGATVGSYEQVAGETASR